MKSTLRSIAAVLPRYGSALGGGAEALTRSLLLALKDQAKHGGIFEVDRVEVWTTCAMDHRTWENALPPGRTVEDGITVHRFPVDRRDLDTFIMAEHAIAAARPLALDEQMRWLAAGVNSTGLYSHIAEHGAEIDALLFAPYLFPTSFWGALIHPDRSVLIPCLHNEGYAYLEVFRALIKRVRGLMFNAKPEMDLASELFGLELIRSKGAVVGMGFEHVADQSTEEAGGGPHLVQGPYLLYSGRKEQGKNVDRLIEWFRTARIDDPQLQLVLIGSGDIHFLDSLPEGVRDLGFVSESEKRRLMRGALALCQPSTNESFSIVLMEAWLEGTPVLVHADCPVTRYHAVTSGGGLYFRSSAELAAILKLLRAEPELSIKLGAAGKHYVQTEYEWTAVMERFARALNHCGLAGINDGTREGHIPREANR